MQYLFGKRILFKSNGMGFSIQVLLVLILIPDMLSVYGSGSKHVDFSKYFSFGDAFRILIAVRGDFQHGNVHQIWLLSNQE